MKKKKKKNREGQNVSLHCEKIVLVELSLHLCAELRTESQCEMYFLYFSGLGAGMDSEGEIQKKSEKHCLTASSGWLKDLYMPAEDRKS